MEIWRGYQWAMSLTSSEGVKAAALGLKRQAKGRSTCLYSHRTAWALLSLGQGHDHPGPGLHWVLQRVDFILWCIHIFPKATPGPLRPAWSSSSSVSSLCSTEKGATGTSGCSVGGDRLWWTYPWRAVLHPLRFHINKTAVSNWQMQAKKKKNCGALILQRSKPSLKRQISCYASFLIYFYFRESGSKSA